MSYHYNNSNTIIDNSSNLHHLHLYCFLCPKMDHIDVVVASYARKHMLESIKQLYYNHILFQFKFLIPSSFEILISESSCIVLDFHTK
jgi:hypothetical protein